MSRRTVEFRVPGKPVGKGRPRFVKKTGRTFTPAATQSAEGDVRRAWENAGEPRLEGPINVRIELRVERPLGHFRKLPRVPGQAEAFPRTLAALPPLSAEGLRHPFPDNQKPDLDNAVKLVMDALNGRLWKDDVQVVGLLVRRVWEARAETLIVATEAL